MSNMTAQPDVAQRPMNRILKYLLQGLFFLPILAGVVIYLTWNGGLSSFGSTTLQSSNTQIISEKTLEERFGVKIKLLAVTAAGGMVDFRYTVTDKDKAEFLVGDAADISLVVENSETVLTTDSHSMKHNQRLENDGIYFHFYPNAGNAVKSGTMVSVDFGSVRLEPIAAQ